jgi:hypothetical protein
MNILSSNIGVRQGDMENLSSNIGVRQGDNTSPTLFKIFINDLVKVFNDSCEPVSIIEKIAYTNLSQFIK